MTRRRPVAVPLLAAAAMAVCSGIAARAGGNAVGSAAQELVQTSQTRRGGFGNWLPWAIGAVILLAWARGE